MLRLCQLLLIGFAALISVGFICGVSVIPGPVVVHGVATNRPKMLRVAITGDPQNYFTTIDGGDAAIKTHLVTLQIDDIIAWHPDFVIVAGDLTDAGGGGDAYCNGNWRIADDPNGPAVFVGPLGTTVSTDDEWVGFRTYEYDRLLAAGIPVFLTIGNHDSCTDFERWFPAAEWNAYSYSGEVDSRASTCGGISYNPPPPGSCAGANVGTPLYTDTTIRKALFNSPLGTVCLLGMPDAVSDVDNTWLLARIGCGTGRPTILVSHAAFTPSVTGATSLFTAASAGQRADVLGIVAGHVIVGVGDSIDTQTDTVIGGTHVLKVFGNSQEVTAGSIGGTNHSGLAWWYSWEIDPAANTSHLQAHNPYLGGKSDPPPGDYYLTTNTTVTLPMNFCTEFGC